VPDHHRRGAAMVLGWPSAPTDWAPRRLSSGYERFGETRFSAAALTSTYLAFMTELQGNEAETTALLKEARVAAAELGYPSDVLRQLEELAVAAARAGKEARAVTLLAAITAARRQHDVESSSRPLYQRMQGISRAPFDVPIEQFRASLGEEGFAAAWAEGEAMTLEQAIAYALSQA
jgi:hypothetical protein